VPDGRSRRAIRGREDRAHAALGDAVHAAVAEEDLHGPRVGGGRREAGAGTLRLVDAHQDGAVPVRREDVGRGGGIGVRDVGGPAVDGGGGGAAAGQLLGDEDGVGGAVRDPLDGNPGLAEDEVVRRVRGLCGAGAGDERGVGGALQDLEGGGVG